MKPIFLVCIFSLLFNTVALSQEPTPPPEIQSPAPTESPVEAYDAQKSPVRLQLPSVAARLGLTDTQRAEVQRLMVLRSQKLAAAPQEQWRTIAEENDKELLAVLTPSQLAFWPKVFTEKTIRISFRMQNWAQVLQWFAEQVGMQLVMDAPPPGTFNYSDNRDYTPSEAIDVLNSVLQTKGFTLVRNDRMLMLFDLKRGPIPVQFLPKLKPEDLVQRGTFEYTTVIFPLERRNRANVIETIQPFKGAFCQVVPMPGNSLMLTDTAGTLLVLQKVIESVENPPAPQPSNQPQQPRHEPNVWKTYTVNNNDPAKIETIFREFAPDAKLLKLGNSNQIHVFLPQDQQAPLEAILNMLEDDSGASRADLELVGYSMAPIVTSPYQLWQLQRRGRRGGGGQNAFDNAQSVGKEIIELLKKSFPTAVVSENPLGQKIVVLASKAEHEKIAALFEQLKQEPRPEEPWSAKLYKFSDPSKKMTDKTLEQFRAILPDATFSLDAEQGQILVVATTKEQEQLTQTLTEIEAAVAPEPDKKIISYKMSSAMTERFARLLSQLVERRELPGLFQLRDPKQGLVTVWATEKQHEVIRQLHEEILGKKSDASTEKPVLVTYPMLQGQAYSAYQVLTNMFSDGEFSHDPRTNAVIAVAPPEQQILIEKAVTELDKGLTEEMAFIKLKKELPGEMFWQFYRVAPKSVILRARRNMQIVVIGPKGEVEKIKKLLTDMDAAQSSTEEVVVHSLQTASPSTARAVLDDLFPEIRVTVDSAHNQLVMTMDAELKEPVTSLLTQLDGKLEFVAVTKKPTEQLLQAIRTAAPRAKIVVDTENAQVMLQGSSADVATMKTILAQAETAVPVVEEVLIHHLKHVDSSTVTAILREMFAGIKITDDKENARLVLRIRPEQKEKMVTLLAQLDAADPEQERRVFKSYPLDIVSGMNRRGDIWDELQKLVPRAKLSFDAPSQQLIVWGTEEEHKIVTEAVAALSGGDIAKKVQRFSLRRMQPWILMSVVNRLYPTVQTTYDWQDNTVIADGSTRLLEKMAELISTLDPAEPSEFAPVVRFYALNAEPTEILVQSLRRLAPHAHVVPDREAKQIMVIANPAEQGIIETNVKTIVATFTAPEEPMLFIYPATPERRERLEAFVKTVASDLKGVAVVPDKSLHQVSVWAKPSEQKLIAEILKQMERTQENESERKLAVFQMSIGDLVTAQEVMKVSHPDATVFDDKQGNRLLVWATENELQKVRVTLNTQGSLDSRTMIPYPVAGTKPETLVKVINDVFQGLKITPEPQTRRILVWASPEEHVTVAEIVEQTNKQEDPNSELAEKFVAYSSAGLDAKTILPLFKTLIPDTDVYADEQADKITVRARTREHEKIKDLFEQLRYKDEKLRPVLAVYPIGDTDPVMLEALLRARLQNAESMTSNEIVELLGWQYAYERYPWYNQGNRNQGPKKVGYFKVDPETQSVHVFVNGEDQADIAQAIEQLVAVGNREGAKPVVKRYSLEEMSVFDIYTLLYKIAPSGNFQPIYNYVPAGDSNDWYANYRSSYRDFLAYTRESEHAKIETLVREMNDKTGSGKKEMLSILLPEGSAFTRESVIKTIQTLYPDSSPMPGGSPQQILVWSTATRLEKIQRLVDEATKPLPDAKKSVLKSYSLRYIGIEDARNWLQAICPTASFDPTMEEGTNVGMPAKTDETKILYVLATPLTHLEIEKSLQELDRDLPDNQKLVPRSYALSDYPPTTFEPLYRSVTQAFPKAVVTIGAEQQSIMVVATEDDHALVTNFLSAYKVDRESKRQTLEVYVLKKLNYYKILPLLQKIVPDPALILPGAKPEQVGVWATPREHEDIARALTKLETAAVETDYQNLRIYKVGDKKAYTAGYILSYQFPGALVLPTSPDEIAVWGSAVDHESVAKMLGVVAEAFPEPTLKTYYFKHIPIGEAFQTLNQMYAGRATMSVRQSSGDLLVQASPEIQARIAKNVSEIDVPRPEGTDPIPVPHDLGDLPVWQVNTVATLINQAFPNQATVFPSSVPGQIVVLAKTAEQEKIRNMIERMKTERPETSGRMEAYTILRGTTTNLQQTLAGIVPNIRFGYGLNPNQLLVWARDVDHAKIKNIVDKLNEPEVGMKTETYSLKNVYSASAVTQIRTLAETLGLDIKTPSYDYYTNQLIVTARNEDHRLIADLLDKLRAADREMRPFPLENVDPMTAYYAINTLFADEPYSTTPGVSPDQTTNMIFVQGTSEQIEKVRKMLIDMGETQLQTSPSEKPDDNTAHRSVTTNRGSIRSITLQGDATATIQELEKLWPLYQRNQLRVIRHNETKNTTETQKPGGAFSIPEPERREDPPEHESVPLPSEQIGERVKKNVGDEGGNPVYVIVNEDGSLTVTSHDLEALDQLEKLVERIDDRVMFEGRDFTMYSVRNVSADLVAQRIRLVLRDRLQGIQRPHPLAPPGTVTPTTARLEIQEDVPNSTITVRGPKFERREVARLIAMFDVSELPGGSATLKPIKVSIKNVQASRVLQQVLSVYQQRLMSIRLPGGATPRVTVDPVTNSIELIVPEPLAGELKEYALEMDRLIQEEPARKIHVIPLDVKSTVIDATIKRIQQSSTVNPYMYGYPYGSPPYMMPAAMPAAVPLMAPYVVPSRPY